jgi:2'-5' RNA ligase
MHIGVAILTDIKVHNIARSITFNINNKYNTGIESALLPQHISLKQSFPYEGDINEIEEYIKEICLNFRTFKIFIDKVEVNSFNGESILGWLKVRECKELRDIHMKLCKGLKKKFNINPLGFDKDKWQFHSTLISSKINKNFIKELISEYNNKEISMEFEAKEVVMFCCMGDGTKTSEYFSLKIFNIGNQIDQYEK